MWGIYGRILECVGGPSGTLVVGSPYTTGQKSNTFPLRDWEGD